MCSHKSIRKRAPHMHKRASTYSHISHAFHRAFAQIYQPKRVIYLHNSSINLPKSLYISPPPHIIMCSHKSIRQRAPHMHKRASTYSHIAHTFHRVFAQINLQKIKKAPYIRKRAPTYPNTHHRASAAPHIHSRASTYVHIHTHSIVLSHKI